MTKVPEIPVTRSVPVDRVGDRATETRASMTRASMGRATTSKAKKIALKEKIKKVLYTNILQLPKEVESRLLSMGYMTRWVRFKQSENGKDDRSNIAKWKEMGYTFVTQSDAPELVFGYTPISHESFGDIITVGDLALAKVPIEVREAITEVKEEETRNRSKGILSKDAPSGISAGRRSFVTRAQRRAEEISEIVEGDAEDLQGIE